MRKILLSLALSTLMLIPFACNKTAETELPTPQKAERTTRGTKSATILGTSVHDFLRSFYNGASYSIGRQIETTDNGTTYLVSEVVVSSARGYIVTNQAGNTPVYFADVDRTNFVLTSVDIASNETVTAQNINQLPEYALTSDFDFIGFVSDPEYNLEGRPFWGWGPTTVLVPCSPVSGYDQNGDYVTSMYTKVRRSYYVLGIKVSTVTSMEEC